MPLAAFNFDFPERLRQELGLSETCFGDAASWQRSTAEYPEAAMAALSPQSLLKRFSEAQVLDQAYEDLINAAHQIAGDSSLLRYWWYCRHEIANPDIEYTTPEIPPSRAKLSGLFLALVALGAVPDLIAIHAARNISADITADTLTDISIWMSKYRKDQGAWGLGQLPWIHKSLCGVLLRIGRLQFHRADWRRTALVFQHETTKGLQLFAAPGLKYRRAGYSDGINGLTENEAWTAEFEEDSDTLRGNPISPDGRALRQKLSIPKCEWRRVLPDDAQVLEVHIPSESPLYPEACLGSFQRAAPIFHDVYPDERFYAFQCGSWLLDGQFPSLLPETSNIVQFQRLFHLFPANIGDGQTFERVFDDAPARGLPMPANTRLQKTLIAHLESGGRFYGGDGVRWIEATPNALMPECVKITAS